MSTSTRKRLGVAAVVISLLVGMVLYLSGTPLLSLEYSHTSSFAEGHVTVQEYRAHWPFLAVCALAVLGLILSLWPAQKPPKLQP